METVSKILIVAIFLSSVFCFSTTLAEVEGLQGKAKGVNLGGWLVIEGFLTPSLFNEIPNPELLDGTQIQLKSATLQKFVAAENGGGSGVSVDRDSASGWETFTLWRISESEFNFRTTNGDNFLICDEDNTVSATAESPSERATFRVERNDNGRVHIKLKNGNYLQGSSRSNQLRADYSGRPTWNDDDSATFQINILPNGLRGDYQLANGYGQTRAREVLEKHKNTFITSDDFQRMRRVGINTVRIPVGWWIANDNNPPHPFIGGSLGMLDKALSWAIDNDIKCIIDLHAAQGSQNGNEHSASRDGIIRWPRHINQTLDVIRFLASRYASHPAVLGFELLNEPSTNIDADTVISYYKRGYEIVRNYSQKTYVIVCQRIGGVDPKELIMAKIGSHNVVIDLHYYTVFTRGLDTIKDNLDDIEKKKSEIQLLDGLNGHLLYIGEWVNEWNVQDATQDDYQRFGKAQLDAYNNASFGWAYWSLRNDEHKRWDFMWSVNNGSLPFSQS